MTTQHYTAHLIDHGHVIGITDFDARPEQAYRVAHDGIDPLSGRWVDYREADTETDNTLIEAKP